MHSPAVRFVLVTGLGLDERSSAGLRERVAASVVLLGPTTEPRLRSVAGLAKQWLRTAVHEPVSAVPLILARWWRTGPRTMAALWRSASPDRIERRLGDVHVPVTVVRGTRDRSCPHDWSARLAVTAPRGRLVEIPGAAHMTPQTHRDHVAPILLAVAPG
ncbi:MAG: alpha/beta hydrolase fold protein [Blastococcus sp.]|nr:alpha/beta hydrolase fold protein [Blastococcus sp.]